MASRRPDTTLRDEIKNIVAIAAIALAGSTLVLAVSIFRLVTAQ